MKSILILVFTFLLSCCYGQNDPLYAQYMNNPMLINPAYAGLNNYFSAAVSYRKQWAGFDGSPTTINVNLQSSMYTNRMGAGLIIVKDNIGVSSNTEIHGTYSYKLNLEGKILAFGLQAGVVNYRINNNELNVYDPNDPAFANINVTKPSFGAGLIFKTNDLFIGISIPRLMRATTAPGGRSVQLYNQHFYGVVGYSTYVGASVRLRPSVLVKEVSGSQWSIDLNMSAILKEQITIGAFVRNLGTLGLLSQIKINDKYKLGYVFEIPTSRSVGAQFTTHEITLGLNMSLLKFHNMDEMVIF